MTTQIRQAVSLNGPWSIRLDEKNQGTAQCWYANRLEREITLSVPGGIQSLPELCSRYPMSTPMQNSYLGSFWMEKEIPLPVCRDKKYFLRLGGVAPTAHVWINSRYAGFIDDPHNEHRLDITDYIADENVRITVLIAEQDRRHMGGLSSFCFKWSGMHRDASIEICAPLYI